MTTHSSPAQIHPEILSVDAARALALRELVPVTETETVALGEALGRVLAEAVASPLDVPAYDNSAMDGYAFDGAALAAANEGELSPGGGRHRPGGSSASGRHAGRCLRAHHDRRTDAARLRHGDPAGTREGDPAGTHERHAGEIRDASRRAGRQLPPCRRGSGARRDRARGRPRRAARRSRPAGLARHRPGDGAPPPARGLPVDRRRTARAGRAARRGRPLRQQPRDAVRHAGDARRRGDRRRHRARRSGRAGSRAMRRGRARRRGDHLGRRLGRRSRLHARAARPARRRHLREPGDAPGPPAGLRRTWRRPRRARARRCSSACPAIRSRSRPLSR